MSTRNKAASKTLAFITRATESRDDAYWEGEFPVYCWSLHCWGVREDGSYEDPSHFIAQIVYDLHSSFARPRRAYSKAPYTVREKGWGEFDIGVEVRFRDSSLAPFKTTVPLSFDPEQETRVNLSFKGSAGSMSAEFRECLARRGKDAWTTRDDLCRSLAAIARDPEALKGLLQRVKQREEAADPLVVKMQAEGFTDYCVSDVKSFLE
jgi:hypothetical protein